MTSLLWVLAVAFVLIGVAGTILPMLPGVALVFGGLLLAAWANGFQTVGWPVLTVLGALALLSFAVDFVASSLGARRVGASRAAMLGAALGTLVGLFFGLPGLLIGPFAGAAAGQFLVRRDLADAGRAGFGAWVGFLIGSLAKLALALAMVAIFTLAWFL
ncbi:MAG: DUF456 family protein [Burkholderiales bacterium]|nr:DUF456 family protein [Burkholderiales bacterium]